MSHDAPRHDLQGAVSPQKTLGQRLREVDGNLPETLRTQCLAAGTAFVPELVAIVEQEMADAQGAHGWAPVHAVELLGMLGDAQAIPVLLRCLQRHDKLDIFYQKVREALVAFGPLAIDPCLDAYAATTDADLRDSLLDILGGLAFHDERIYEVLLDSLERSPELAAMYLAEYGDPRALSALSQMFDTLPVHDDDMMLGNHVFVELRCAIEELGGHLTAAQAAKAERADAPRQRFAARIEQAVAHLVSEEPIQQPSAIAGTIRQNTVTPKKRKLGRNERCWCGSGKKYKKCHLDAD